METKTLPRGLATLVAARVGCTAQYTRRVLKGLEPNTTIKTALMHKAARDIMAELFPATDNEAK